MNEIMEAIFNYDEHWRPEGIDFSVSELASKTDYQLWLSKIGTPKTYKIKPEHRLQALIGTGFHLLAEKAVGKLDGVEVEKSMVFEIAGIKVSGTFDLHRDLGLVHAIGDHKVKGSFQFQKILTGETDEILYQLSLYRYGLYQTEGIDAELGEGYIFHAGDRSYLSKAVCEKLGLPLKSQIPKYKLLEMKLMDHEEVEKYVEKRMKAIEHEPELDCQVNWQCDYCEFECRRRKV